MQKSESFAPIGLAQRKKRNAFADFFNRLVTQKPLGTVGGILVLIMFFSGIFANVISPYPESELHMLDRLASPSATYMLGTDYLGRDLLTRIIFGARVSMIIGLSASALGGLTATIIGTTSGYLGGKYDILVQRFVDTWICFPSLIIYLTLMSVIGRGMLQLILVLGIGGGIASSRLIRSYAIGLKSATFVEAAHAQGDGFWYILLKHIIPNVLPIIIINFTLAMAGIILAEASLSFLGLGLPPDVPSWGGMLSGSNRLYMEQYPGLVLWPGLALSLSVYGINMFGDALRDLLDPRLRGGLGGLGNRGRKLAQKAQEKRVARAANTQGR